MTRDELFFHQRLIFEINWQNQHPLRIGLVTGANKDQISRSLKDLSSESIRNRFMGSKKEFSPEELEYLTNLDGWNHFALGVEEKENSRKGIAIARMVRSSTEPREAEIALTIIDEYQKKGLGSILMKLIVLAASEREITRLSFTFLPQNEGIIKLINKVGPHKKRSTQMDSVQYIVEMSDVNRGKLKNDLLGFFPQLSTFPIR